MNDIPIPKLLATARRVVKLAAASLKKDYQRVHIDGQHLDVRTKESATDLVTDVDGRTQELLIREIQKEFPDHRFLCEEQGAENLGDATCPYEWVIDPLDGTVNFVHGRNSFGTIVAVRKGDEILAGAMELPLLELQFWGSRGGGAFQNGKPVKLRATASMNDAVFACNMMRRAKEVAGTLRVSVPACASVENYGCAAEELGQVLLGCNDGVFYDGIRLWDIAVGFLLIEEAGGRTRMDAQEPENPRGGYRAAAATAPVFEELWEFVEKKM